MRQFYDAEKEMSDKLVQEEKERFSRKIQQVQDELEIKHKEDQHNYESEITALQDQLHHIKNDQETQTKLLEQELLNKKNLINQLQHQLQEIKDQLKQSELTKSQTFDKSFIQLEQHKNSLQEKIDQLTNNILEKERQLSGLQHKIERQNEQIERMKQEQITQEQQFCQERQTLVDKYETNKKKMADLQDELIQKNNESSRQQALLEQQVEFQNRKIEDLQKSAENIQKQFDGKISKNHKIIIISLGIQRQEIFADAQAQVDRVTSEKDLWESKYDQKRKALKEVEAQLSAQVLKLEKQNVQLQSQLTRLKSELEQKENNYSQETQNLKQQLANLDSSAGQAYFLGSAQAEDMIRLKGQLQECERELQDCQSNYDRDRALWEGKCLFLEQQKDTYKRDLIDSQRKFQLTLVQLQKRSSQDKEKQESNQNQMIKMLESKYKNQIKDIVTANQILVSELQYKIKRLESELPVLQEKQNIESRNKLDDTIQLERKLADSEQMVSYLRNELQEEKQERQRRLAEIQRQLQREKEVNKQKIYDIDKKSKDTQLQDQNKKF